MQLEAGKFYRTRDGRKVGPLQRWAEENFIEVPGDGRLWGTSGVGHNVAEGEDLIAEWIDGPIRTVTRKEVVPGGYGKLTLFDDGSAILADTTDTQELRAAARIFNEIADALEAE